MVLNGTLEADYVDDKRGEKIGELNTNSQAKHFDLLYVVKLVSCQDLSKENLELHNIPASTILRNNP